MNFTPANLRPRLRSGCPNLRIPGEWASIVLAAAMLLAGVAAAAAAGTSPASAQAACAAVAVRAGPAAAPRSALQIDLDDARLAHFVDTASDCEPAPATRR